MTIDTAATCTWFFASDASFAACLLRLVKLSDDQITSKNDELANASLCSCRIDRDVQKAISRNSERVFCSRSLKFASHDTEFFGRMKDSVDENHDIHLFQFCVTPYRRTNRR